MDKETTVSKSLGVEFFYSDGAKSFINPQDGIKPELFYENMIDWDTAEKLNIIPFNFWDHQKFKSTDRYRIDRGSL